MCVLRYKRHYYAAHGISTEAAKAQFLERAGEEQQHVDWIAERSLSWAANLILTRRLGEPLSLRVQIGVGLTDMIKEDLVAEHIAVETYSEVVRWLANAVR